MAFSLANADIPTTLVSTASLERMKANIASCTYKLSAREQEVSDYCMEKFFKPLEGKEDWEGKEVASYWEKVGKRFICTRLYPG